MSESFFTIFFITLSLVLLILTGYFWAKKCEVSKGVVGQLSKLLINVLLPCFYFSNIIKLEEDLPFSLVALSGLAGFFNYCFALLICSVLFRFVRRKMIFTKLQSRSFIFSMILQNYGYLPIPLVGSLFLNDPLILVLLFIHNCFVELAIWTVGITYLKGDFNKHFYRSIFNMPFIAIVLGLFVHYLDIPVASVLVNFTGLAGQATIPMALIVVGTTMAGINITQSKNLSKKKLRYYIWRIYAMVFFLRHFLLPLLILLFAYLFVSSPELTKVLILEAAMPAALFPLVIIQLYKGSFNLVARAIIFSTIVGFLMIPVIILLTMKVFFNNGI